LKSDPAMKGTGMVAAKTSGKKTRQQDRHSGFLLLAMPALTVFVSSGCIMTLELVGGRLIARYLGASLYTWTSIIGVVLLGISIGNYIGGRIADRFATGKALAILFMTSSVACVLTISSNNLVSTLMWPAALSWPMRVAIHVCLVFLLPSVLLGTIGPIVAKRALQQGLAAGRTIGDLYAWGAIGSIVGTFATGFYFIARVGTVTTIWGIGAVLLLMSIAYWPRFRAAYVWAIIFAALMIVTNTSGKWAETVGSLFFLSRQRDPRILYESESQYSYISVRQLSTSPDIRSISLNNDYARNRIVMDDIRILPDPYMRIYAAVTSRFGAGKDALSVLVLGGGGYVYPRYVEDVWPKSHIDVVEIDPRITEAAVEALGLDKDTSINIITMDARNYIDGLLERRRNGLSIRKYDFIYGDTFNDLAVPYQLVTREFNDKIAAILTDDGIYMLNVIDLYDSGRFLGALANTLGKTFAEFHIVSRASSHSKCNSFVIIAGKRRFSIDGIDRHEMLAGLHLEVFSDSQIETLVDKANHIVLTDDYAPVENLLAPAVVRAFQKN